MTKALPFALAGALLCGLGATAGAAEATRMHHGAMSPAGARTPAGRAFAAANAAMMKGMDVEPSGDPDRDFVSMMLPHHQGAVAMARVEIRYGRDPMLRKLAADIVRAQAIEIARMRAWREKHAK